MHMRNPARLNLAGNKHAEVVEGGVVAGQDGANRHFAGPSCWEVHAGLTLGFPRETSCWHRCCSALPAVPGGEPCQSSGLSTPLAHNLESSFVVRVPLSRLRRGTCKRVTLSSARLRVCAPARPYRWAQGCLRGHWSQYRRCLLLEAQAGVAAAAAQALPVRCGRRQEGFFKQHGAPGGVCCIGWLRQGALHNMETLLRCPNIAPVWRPRPAVVVGGRVPRVPSARGDSSRVVRGLLCIHFLCDY